MKNVLNLYKEHINWMWLNELSQESIALEQVIETIKEVTKSKILLEWTEKHESILDEIEWGNSSEYIESEDEKMEIKQIFRDFDRELRELEIEEADRLLEKYVKKTTLKTLNFEEIYYDLEWIRDYSKLWYLLKSIISLIKFSSHYSVMDFMDWLSEEIRTKKIFWEFSVDDLILEFNNMKQKKKIVEDVLRSKIH